MLATRSGADQENSSMPEPSTRLGRTKPTRVPTRTPDSLDRLRDEAVNLVSWRRMLPSGLNAQLVDWAHRRAADFDDVVSIPNAELDRATAGLAEPARAWVVGDIARLLGRFGDHTGARRVRVVFGAVRTDQCRKFHIDYVRYRLVTTYVGPGTEWVPDHAVRRSALDAPPVSATEANQQIVSDSSAVRRAAAGEVVVMKGADHPSGRAAVHRSPPIGGSDGVRVVLAISTV